MFCQMKISHRYGNNLIQKLCSHLFICQRWHFFINPVWKQMCCNSWTGTGDQSIYFSHVCRETTYKLRLYLSYNSSQVWPTRISRVMESVFRCSGPNSKSVVTLTRPTQRKNASLHLLPLFSGSAATGDSDIDYCETKISSRSAIIKTNAVPLNAKHTKTWNLWDSSVSDFRGYSAACPLNVYYRVYTEQSLMWRGWRSCAFGIFEVK